MATPGASGSSNSSPRWRGTGDPGTAFSGLSRGRGRGRSGGRGRGRARGGLSEVDIPSTKPDNSQSSASPSTKSLVLPSPSSTPILGKPNVPLSSKPKSASRKGSRAISVTVVPQITESVVTPSVSTLTPVKVSPKRRRSQAAKPAVLPPKANPPKLTDSSLRSNKLHIESHTETPKDLPPHLNIKFDVRNDIDALVERVRAVAMDNRPSTPKSHIDWADDDDTLPDLDDWGVTTSTLTTQLEGISPIIVDGLRSLPEFAANSTVPSSLKHVEAVVVHPMLDAQSSSVNDMTPDTVVPPNPLNTKEGDLELKSLPESIAKHDSSMIIPFNSKIKSPQPNSNTSLYSTLPAKPLSIDSIVQHTRKSRSRTSPMRFVSHLKSSIIPVADLSETAPNSEHVREPVEIAFEMTDHKTATPTPEPRSNGPEHFIVVEPTVTDSIISNVSPDNGADVTQTAQESSLSGLSGLGASMHAPKGIVDSVSAPVHLSTYANSRGHDPIHTHTRAHTVGRSPLPDSTSVQGGYLSRITRSGHATPRGGLQATSHARTHSTPPGGINHHRSSYTSRPVITGDAMSRLARTIEKTHNKLSPPTSHSAVTSDS